MRNKTAYKPKRMKHTNFTKRYWKDRAIDNEVTGIYSPENLARMRLGKAPRRLAAIRHKKTGETIEFHAPIELHHVFGMVTDSPPAEQTYVEVYPWQHAAMDDNRKFNWEFVEWRGFQ